MMSDYQWLEKMHQEYYATLLRLARRRLQGSLRSSADAEDIVQEAFLLAARKDISKHEAPLKWLMKVTSNLCRRRTEKAFRELDKQQRVIRERMDHSPDRSIYAVERQESEAEMLEALLTMEQMLNDSEWNLVKEVLLEGKSAETVAEEQGVSANVIRVRMHRARKKIRNFFG